jgi:hypothetical protein
MPDIEQLMDVWPEELEEAIGKVRAVTRRDVA